MVLLWCNLTDTGASRVSHVYICLFVVGRKNNAVDVRHTAIEIICQ